MPFKPPFRGLRRFVAVSALVLLISPLNLFYSPDSDGLRDWNIGFFSVVIPLWSVLLWRLWHGSAVARTISWWVAAVALFNSAVGGVNHEGLPKWALWFDDASYVFPLFALIWLQLPGVKAHFRREAPV